MDRIRIEHGDSREVIKTLADGSIDSCVTDPPYSLQTINKRFAKVGRNDKTWSSSGPHQRTARGFMNQKWDTGETAFNPEFWAEVYRVLKPGAHVVAFGGTRTYHRLACAIEDAGFEIRDQVGWLFGSGFPKSHDVGKKLAEWQGWGTALKPAWEPICLARKPLDGTVAANVMEHGTGALNIDASRIKYVSPEDQAAAAAAQRLCHDNPGATYGGIGKTGFTKPRESIAPYIEKQDMGRWPANVIHDGSDEVERAFPDSDGQLRATTGAERAHRTVHAYGEFKGARNGSEPRGDSGSAARFFYSAKADAEDRLGSKHPTVKPVDLIAYLARLVTPPGGLILDPFAGTGTLGAACMREGFRCILIEREAQYVADIKRRLDQATGANTPLFAGAA